MATPAEVSTALQRLEQVLEAAPPLLLPALRAGAPAAKPGGWTAPEILGHLIDSALNNLQRVVRLQLAPSLAFPGYDSDRWVAVQAYRDRPVPELLSEWAVLNRHFLHVSRATEAAALGHLWIDGGNQTLGFIIVDYVDHLVHHLAEIVPAGQWP